MLDTTIAGSLPKPSWLAEPEKLWAAWRVPPESLAQAQRDAVLVALREQETAGIDVVTDGEQSRQHFVHGFLERLHGRRGRLGHRGPGPCDRGADLHDGGAHLLRLRDPGQRRLEEDARRRVAAVRAHLSAARQKPDRPGVARVRQLAGPAPAPRAAARQGRHGRRHRRRHARGRDGRAGGADDPRGHAPRRSRAPAAVHQLRHGAAAARRRARQAGRARRRRPPRAPRARTLMSAQDAWYSGDDSPLPLGAPFRPGLDALPSRQHVWAVLKDAQGRPVHGEPREALRAVTQPLPAIGPNEALGYVLYAGLTYNTVFAACGVPISVFDLHDRDLHVPGSGALILVAAVGAEVAREGRLQVGELRVLDPGVSDLLSPRAGECPMDAERQ